MGKPNRPSKEILQAWADDLNGWYAINISIDQVRQAYRDTFPGMKTYDGTSYIATFLRCKDGSFTKHLDTADREMLADAVEKIYQRKQLNLFV